MATFTFITNHKGGIYIRQVSAKNVSDACRVWANEVVTQRDIDNLNENKFIKSFLEDLTDLPPVPIQNTPNVWGFSVGSGKNFMLINIVKTSTTNKNGHNHRRTRIL